MDRMRLGYVHLPGRGETDRFLAEVVAQLEAAGLCLAGTVQTNVENCERGKCDMDLRVLPDGPTMRISQDLGAASRGCRLDAGALETAVVAVTARLDGAEMLVINKFGKQEAEGRGLAPVIADALDRGLPVLVGVNRMNADAFAGFVDGLAKPLPADVTSVVTWCLTARGAQAA
jgi:hypothetical protein